VFRVFRGERFQNQVLHVLRPETGLEFDASDNGCSIYDAAGKLVLGFITIRDITEQRKAEMALRASEERFRVAQELSPDGFSILQPVRNSEGRVVDFTWVYANAATERSVDMKLPVLEGRSLLGLFPGHHGSPFLEAYQQAAETGKTCVLELLYPAMAS
jgi:PAS domain-containing protein